ncbi:restriction endonuclease subunit R [Brachybacterium vulturis]|uniref:Type I restriction enzyme endonuclease subunit n=1 Tax=Brachybacterium vulturis TaxID=2017484 RepID=A0A291GQ27_9MICO|nr:HsdR family type I site-specific deoxyribonuclease [Brachybacterium vulturis]ATG52074.1 restriction endonuclease subunit R [Brachybacterium vulturis]
MSTVGQRERETQRRVVELFRDQLGYVYGGNLKDQDNWNVDETRLRSSLLGRGYDEALVSRAVQQLLTAAALSGGSSLYDQNRKVYELLRYGAKVKTEVGETTQTVHLIDWAMPAENEFVVAEEVTVRGVHTKRPDLVLYVNGIALAVIELKRSTVSAASGIRQNIGNQRDDFVRPFFTTVQYLFAGNDVEGLRYGVIETQEKYWLRWKEDGENADLDLALAQMCSKERFLELIHDFIVYDAGVKKAPRHNQYFGVKVSQARIARREGGIIWHTQGSGKSLTMVWLAKWILETQRDARVLMITDRTELDDQIEGGFIGVGEKIVRTQSGADMLAMLNTSNPPLMCSLVHKFRGGDDSARGEAAEDFAKDLKTRVPDGFTAKGNVFVFVDEAHRTQSGKMHRIMKDLLPGALFIGFTGTPLLKDDKKTSIETFGSFIHTYKFDEGVRDGVVLDLKYEARKVEQELQGSAAVDKWFEAKTRNLTDLSKARLKKKWGTMQKVFSSAPRTAQIVQDILMDMETQPRLVSGHGNAMLVSDSVYQACTFYEAFVKSGFKGKIAIVTSYKPNPSAIAKEDAGEGDTEELRKYEIYRQMLADHFGEDSDKAINRVEDFEADVKKKFIHEPGQMRLLIVVDKLLTGFDAPSATYLYIDKNMRDHGLFQAICRVNRLDGDDKSYGYIVDYRDLFKSLDKTVTDYTSEAFGEYDDDDVDGLISDRDEQDRADLDDALDAVRALCEPVLPPKGTLEYQRYFVATTPGDAEQIKDNEPRRVLLYKSVASLVRAFGAVASDMESVGFSAAEMASIKDEVEHYTAVKREVEAGAGENIDVKQYEAGMRQLLDTYVHARPVDQVADLEKTLVQLIVERGSEAIDSLPAGIRSSGTATAETIINNVRKTIVDEHAMNPRYYDHMSELLDALIEKQREDAEDYATYLHELIEFTNKVGSRDSADGSVYPEWASTPARRAIVDFPWSPEDLAVDHAALYQRIQSSKDHGWADGGAGARLKERALARELRSELPGVDDGSLGNFIEMLKNHEEYR